jgi:hypothetical protein
MLSYEKLEKVVYPPQMPVIRNSLHSVVSVAYLSEKPYSRPIIKHPVIFTRNVPAGKATVTSLLVPSCTR